MSYAPPGGQTGINVTASFFPLLWILYFIKPKVVINGVETQGRWKEPMFFPTGPGNFEVKTYFPYLIPSKAGMGTIGVTVNPGQVVNVTYKAPWIVFLKGKMTAS